MTTVIYMRTGGNWQRLVTGPGAKAESPLASPSSRNGRQIGEHPMSHHAAAVSEIAYDDDQDTDEGEAEAPLQPYGPTAPRASRRCLCCGVWMCDEMFGHWVNRHHMQLWKINVCSICDWDITFGCPGKAVRDA
jgi:hypothetical protein